MKNKIHHTLVALHILAALLLLTSCGKSNIPVVVSSSLTIVNAIPGSAALVTNFSPDPKTGKIAYYTAQQIPAGSYIEFSGYEGIIPLAISQVNDTTHTVYNGVLNIVPGTIHSLFLTGTLANPDSLQTIDQIPVITDSAIGIRFVNLSAGSNPVSVNIKGSQGSPLTTGLAYKSITAFQTLPASSVTPAGGSYVFEFRDAATSALLTSYTLSALSAKYFKSMTLVLKGLPGATGATAQGTILVNNY